MEYLPGLVVMPLLFVGLVYLVGWLNRTASKEECDSRQEGTE